MSIHVVLCLMKACLKHDACTFVHLKCQSMFPRSTNIAGDLYLLTGQLVLKEQLKKAQASKVLRGVVTIVRN